MSRRHRAERRQILPYPIYVDLVLAKFINHMMMKCNKSIDRSLFYWAMYTTEAKARDLITYWTRDTDTSN